jgi:hypothetical protein
MGWKCRYSEVGSRLGWFWRLEMGEHFQAKLEPYFCRVGCVAAAVQGMGERERKEEAWAPGATGVPCGGCSTPPYTAQ